MIVAALIAATASSAAAPATTSPGSWGYLLVFVTMIAQCAGVPLPAVSVLLASDVAAEHGELSLGLVIALGSAGAIIGSEIGYLLGRIGGRPLMLRLAHRLHADEERIDAMERFFARHGGKAVFFGRWVVVVRMWGAIAAGAAHMPWPRFLLWNTLGSVVWVTSLTLLAAVAGDVARALNDWLNVGGWILVAVIVTGTVVAELRRRARRSASGA